MTVCKKVIVVTVKGQIVEQNSPIRSLGIRGATGDDDNPALPGEEHTVQESIYKDEVSQVIDDKMFLDAVDKFAVIAATKISGVTNQYVDGCLQTSY